MDAIPATASINDGEENLARAHPAAEDTLLPEEDSLCSPSLRPATTEGDIDTPSASPDCPGDFQVDVDGDRIVEEFEPKLVLGPVQPDAKGDGVIDGEE